MLLKYIMKGRFPMKLKKFISLAIASTLALSMSAPAFAIGGGGSTTTPTEPDTPTTPTEPDTPTTPDTPAETPSSGLDENGQISFDYKGETWDDSDATISVIIPSQVSNAVILNPYELTYLGDDKTAHHYGVITGKYNYIENVSDMALQVAWEVTGKVTGNVNLVTSKPAVNPATNDLLLPVAIGATADKKTAPAPMKASAAANLFVTTETQKSNPAPAQAAQWATTYSKPVILDNPNWTHSWESKTGAGNLIVAKPYLGFGIVGELAGGTADTYDAGEAWINNDETKLTNKWTTDDTVSVNMVFTFSKAPSYANKQGATS